MNVMLVVGMTAGQGGVYQPASFPLTGYFQPLTFPSLPNTNVYQQQGQQSTLQQPQQQDQQQVFLTNQQPSITPTGTAVASDQYQPQAQQTPVVAGPTAVVNNVKPDGTYAFGYQTPDGQLRAESVQADGTRVGSYTYKTPEGQLITINYTAGKHGFQTSPGTTVAAASSTSTSDVSSLSQTSSVSVPSSAPVPAPPSSSATTVATGNSGAIQPFVLYSPTSQLGLPTFYPFSRFTAQTATVEQSQAQGNAGTSAAATPSQQPNTVPAIATPVGFSYGSNPQAIQQLQRLLLV